MAMYTYSSIDARGKKIRGSMDAANVPDLELRLKRMELDLIDCKLAGNKSHSFGSRKITRKDLINFCFHMEQLTTAGVPILDGLEDLRDSTNQPRFREIIADLIENIEGGSQLSTALARHPKVFDKTFTSLIHAGEQSGKLGVIFKNLSDTLKWEDELAAQTKTILMYPAFVAIFVFGAVIFLMVYLVPKLSGFIKNLGGELPAYTQSLISTSSFIINYWYVLILAPVLVVLIVVIWIKSSPGARYKMDDYKLRVPLFGPILHKIILARFAGVFGLMYASGITIMDCIRLSIDIVNNQVVAEALDRAGVFIAEGQSVTAAFQSTGIFPPLVIRMLKIGESTGSLDTALANVGYFYDREVKEMIGKIQVMIQPMLTVILGLLLAWIMLSVFGPIYDTMGKMKF
jgi:type IV pilus assembly protein PilC